MCGTADFRRTVHKLVSSGTKCEFAAAAPRPALGAELILLIYLNFRVLQLPQAEQWLPSL